MKPIEPAEILEAASYERLRPEMRRRILVLKGKRRVPIGSNATLHFETRETMLYQVHEMLRAESSWTRPGAVEAELEAYNPLVPAGRELSATLMIEVESPEERALKLTRLLGLERHIWIEVGGLPRLGATLDAAQIAPTRLSSVQHLKWKLTDEHVALVRQAGTVLKIVVDHPEYAAVAVLSEETRQELAADQSASEGGDPRFSRSTCRVASAQVWP